MTAGASFDAASVGAELLPANGGSFINGWKSEIYTPNDAAAQALQQGHVGEDTFTYTVKDPEGETAQANLTFDVAGENVTCYCPGTHILTDNGEVAVEKLAIGDKIVTLHGEARQIKWIGRRSYDGRFVAGQPLMLPIRIRRGAIEDNVPARDLFVSPGHAICIDGALAPAWRLLNGVSITQAVKVESVTYLHVELDDHEVIFAEGCLRRASSTTIAATSSRTHWNSTLSIPDRPLSKPITCLPRLEDGFHLREIQLRLAERAGVSLPSEQSGPLRGYVDVAGPIVVAGWAQSEIHPEAPMCLDILVGGRRVMRVLANRYRADLRQAGLGSGKHAFEVALPVGVSGRVEVRRSSDQSALELTEAAAARAA